MIADVLTNVATSRSMRVLRGRLNKRRIEDAFKEIRVDLNAKTLHANVRQRDQGTGVLWSLWIGRFDKQVSFLLPARFHETRYAFLLLLEHDGYIGVTSSNVGDVSGAVSDDRVPYGKMLALHAAPETEVESLGTRRLRFARIGVTRTTQSGRHLEQALPRVGAHQAAPSHMSIRRGDRAWRVAPSSGRLIETGGRVTIPELCAWFAGTCEDIEDAQEPTDFIKAFAHPVELTDVPADVVPTAVQLDPAVLDDLLGAEANLARGGVELTEADIGELRKRTRELWVVKAQRSKVDEQAGIWRLQVNNAEVGRLTVRKTKISLSVEEFENVSVQYADGTSERLNQVFNGSEQPFRITYSDVTYAYTAGQLFRDHRLLGSRSALLDVLSPTLPANASEEKGYAQDRFTDDSLFGMVVNQLAGDDQFLICEDLGKELADFIGVAISKRSVTFYHCKGGSTDVGASGLHEVVSQATKNLGFLTASRAELERRAARWGENWNQTAVPRLQRGACVADFIQAYADAVAAPQATSRVVLVVSALSKSAVQHAFQNLDGPGARPEAVHVLWLLSAFVDQCRAVGAVPEVVCRA